MFTTLDYSFILLQHTCNKDGGLLVTLLTRANHNFPFIMGGHLLVLESVAFVALPQALFTVVRSSHVRSSCLRAPPAPRPVSGCWWWLRRQ